MMSVPRQRLLQLMQARCRVFATTFNPDGIRMGNKVLRQRLRGPALASYYPRKMWQISDFAHLFGQEVEILNEEEDERLEALILKKGRGKGAPKKKSGPPVDIKGKKR